MLENHKKMTASALKIDVTSNVDAIHLCQSLDKAQKNEDPYRHYLLSSLFDPALIDDVLSIPFEPIELSYEAGTREEFNAVRRYFTPDVIEEYECARRVADAFLDPEVIRKIESMEGVCLKDSLLRIEYAIDADKFWLKPHTDLGVKLVTMLIYLSKDEDAENWGTDIYVDEDTFHSTVPYKTNNALLFFATDKTWHGFEPRTIKGIRKTLIVNFVTQEWRNRQELVHPTRAVY